MRNTMRSSSEGRRLRFLGIFNLKTYQNEGVWDALVFVCLTAAAYFVITGLSYRSEFTISITFPPSASDFSSASAMDVPFMP